MLVEGEEKGKKDAHGKEDAQDASPVRLHAFTAYAAVQVQKQIGKTDGVGRGQKHLGQGAGKDGRAVRPQAQMKKHVDEPGEHECNGVA